MGPRGPRRLPPQRPLPGSSRTGDRALTTSPPPAGGGRSTSLRHGRQELLERLDLRGTAFCRQYAAVTDEWLRGVFRRAVGDSVKGLSLVAVGGYGRGELCPGSDLDLLLVHSRREGVAGVAEGLWYPIWDEGLRLDHSVRTPKEVLVIAERDLKVALGLLDARLLAGDEAVYGSLHDKARDLWRSRSRRWLPDLLSAVTARHTGQGDVAFLLEPDLKEGRGGLRDVHALQAAALASPVLEGVLEDPELTSAVETLVRIRVELQRPTGRPLDQLLLQEQDRVAAALELPDADQLMAEVAAAGRTIAVATDDGWRRVSSWLAGPKGRRGGRDTPLGAGFVLRDGEVALTAEADPATDPSLVLRLAAGAAELGVPLARDTLDRLAARAAAPTDPWSDEFLQAFVSVLGAGPPAIPVLEALDQRGILVRLLPEWAAVRNRPQRNAYHRFTVDRHLLETAAAAAALVRRVARPDLLLVAALLHDIGKGYPGDHTEAGIAVVEPIVARMGFSAGDVGTLVTLVRHHLLLADTATRRDLDDPATAAAVADAVGDRTTLELLAALTEADSEATGPSAWGQWKAGLVEKLVARVGDRLAGHDRPQLPAVPTPAQSELMARRELQVVPEGSSVTVVAPDRRGLLALVAGTLALHGLDVRSASAVPGEEGMALEVFEVEPSFGGTPDWERVRRDIEAAYEGRLALDARLVERDLAYAGRRRLSAARPAETRVLIDNEASATATVVEVRAPDASAVLYRITRALAERDLDVSTARVSTLGSEVVDAFYVRTPEGSKLTDPIALGRLERAILLELGG